MHPTVGLTGLFYTKTKKQKPGKRITSFFALRVIKASTHHTYVHQLLRRYRGNIMTQQARQIRETKTKKIQGTMGATVLVGLRRFRLDENNSGFQENEAS